MILSPFLGSEKANQFAPVIRDSINKVTQGGYKNTKSDLLRAIKETNMSKQQLAQMVGMTKNPFVSNLLNRFAPNLSEQLQGLGQEVFTSDMPNTPEIQAPNPGGFRQFLPINNKR